MIDSLGTARFELRGIEAEGGSAADRRQPTFETHDNAAKQIITQPFVGTGVLLDSRSLTVFFPRQTMVQKPLSSRDAMEFTSVRTMCQRRDQERPIGAQSD